MPSWRSLVRLLNRRSFHRLVLPFGSLDGPLRCSVQLDGKGETGMIIRDSDAETVEAKLRRHQRTPEEVARLADGIPPFSYEEWRRDAPPATPEELADWEEFL